MRTSNQAFGATPEQMAVRAAEILRENDLGGWTKAAPRLYPHQWSWDSAFIAIGLAHLDTRRAAQELRMLFKRAVDDGHGAAYRLQPGGKRLLPEHRTMGDGRLAEYPDRDTDERHVPAARPCHRRPLHLGDRPTNGARRRAPTRPLSCGRSTHAYSRGIATSRPTATRKDRASSRSITRGRAARTTRPRGTARWRASRSAICRRMSGTISNMRIPRCARRWRNTTATSGSSR